MKDRFSTTCVQVLLIRPFASYCPFPHSTLAAASGAL